MTYEVQQNRWDQLIRRASGSIGPGSRVAETIAELFPMFDVENMPAELMFLSGTKLGWAGAQVVGAATKLGGVQLFNPVDSGHLVAVDSIEISVNPVQQLSVGITTIAFPTNTGLGQLRDTRTGIQVLTVGQLRTGTDVVASLNMSMRLLGNVEYSLDPPNGVGVLFPGTGISVVMGNPASTVNAAFFWHERPALESELNF